jgi:hypothetical protein
MPSRAGPKRLRYAGGSCCWIQCSRSICLSVGVWDVGHRLQDWQYPVPIPPRGQTKH